MHVHCIVLYLGITAVQSNCEIKPSVIVLSLIYFLNSESVHQSKMKSIYSQSTVLKLPVGKTKLKRYQGHGIPLKDFVKHRKRSLSADVLVLYVLHLECYFSYQKDNSLIYV